MKAPRIRQTRSRASILAGLVLALAATITVSTAFANTRDPGPAGNAEVAPSTASSGPETGSGARPGGEIDESALLLDDGSVPSPAGAGSGSTRLLEFVLVFAAVAVVLYGILRSLRAAHGAQEGPERSPIVVAATTRLTQGAFVHAVCMGDRVWIVATSGTAVTLLETIEDRETAAWLLAGAAPRKKFVSERLTAFFGSRGAGRVSAGSADSRGAPGTRNDASDAEPTGTAQAGFSGLDRLRRLRNVVKP